MLGLKVFGIIDGIEIAQCMVKEVNIALVSDYQIWLRLGLSELRSADSA